LTIIVGAGRFSDSKEPNHISYSVGVETSIALGLLSGAIDKSRLSANFQQH